MPSTFNANMLDIAEEWAVEHGADAIDIDEASEWAVKTGRYQREPISPEKQCKQDMRKALQGANYNDPQGNKVRTKHPIRNYKGQQMTLWIDVRTGKPDMMAEAFSQSYVGIGNDVKRHSIEHQSYNLNNPYNATIPMFDYDFNKVAEDARMSGEYDDTYDETDEDEDSD